MNSQIQYTTLKNLLLPICLFACLLVFQTQAEAQEKPPRPILVTVDVAAQLNFGKFIPFGSGGKVIVDSDGNRQLPLGNVILVNSYTSAARYVVDAEPGTLITIAPITYATLTGSNGGLLRLDLGEPRIESRNVSTFVTTNQYTDVFLGGTLTVGSLQANPAGIYSGTFLVTFIQE